MKRNYYKNMVSVGAHASAPFQQKILTDWLKWITKNHSIKTALDVGSGLGFNLSTLSQFGFKVWSTDVSLAALREAKKRHPNLKNINYLVGDAQKLKFPNNHFDLVVCAEVLEHIPNQKEVINECARVLKNGGFLIISTPNYQNLTGVIKRFMDKKAGHQYWEPWGAHQGGLEKPMRPHLLKQLLSPHFQILKSRGANFLLAWFYFFPFKKYYDLFPLLVLGKIPFIKKFGMEYYILARKNDKNLCGYPYP